MKTDTLLLLGALAAGAYFLFKKDTMVSGDVGGVIAGGSLSAAGQQAANMKPVEVYEYSGRQSTVNNATASTIPTEREVQSYIDVVTRAFKNRSVTESQKRYIASTAYNPVSVQTIGRLGSVAVNPHSTYRV